MRLTGICHWAGKCLRKLSVFGVGQNHAVHQCGADVKEVAVKQAAGQQHQNGGCGENLSGLEVVAEQHDCLQPVEQVRNQSHRAATCHKLYEGIVPPGWQEALEALHRGPAPGGVLRGEKSTAEYGVFGIELEAVPVNNVPVGGVKTLAEQ